VIVGTARPENGQYEAFRWTEETGLVGLGDLPGGGIDSRAHGVSADGAVIVGWAEAESPVGKTAFVWDAEQGMRALQDVLVHECQLDLEGWALEEAHGVSDDGFTVVGWGYNPVGDKEAWIAVIPEPTSFLMLLVGGLALMQRRQQCRADPRR